MEKQLTFKLTGVVEAAPTVANSFGLYSNTIKIEQYPSVYKFVRTKEPVQVGERYELELYRYKDTLKLKLGNKL